MVVTWRFVALMLVGLVPLILFGSDPQGVFVLLAGWIAFAIAVAVIDMLIAASPRKVKVERGLSQRVRLGQTASTTLYLTNVGKRTIHGRVRDAWEPSAGAPRMRLPLTIPGGERRVLRVELSPTRRGTRRAQFVTVRSYGPLRIAARQASLDAPGEVRVLPPFNSRRHLPSRLARLRELEGQTSLMVRGQGTEFDSLRDYVRGDDVRSLDWRATARRQSLVVRTWRPERDRKVVIIIDTGRSAAVRVDDETRLDTAIESSLLMAALASRAGDHVTVVALDRLVRARVHNASAAEILPRITEAMADVEPQLIEPDWAAVPGIVRDVTTQRSLVLLLTTVDSPGQADALFETVTQLAQRHVVVIGNVSNPDVARLANDRSDREAVYRAAAAERMLIEQDRVSLALTQLGADVVTAAPKDLPPKVADRYLALKKAGRL